MIHLFFLILSPGLIYSSFVLRSTTVANYLTNLNKMCWKKIGKFELIGTLLRRDSFKGLVTFQFGDSITPYGTLRSPVSFRIHVTFREADSFLEFDTFYDNDSFHWLVTFQMCDSFGVHDTFYGSDSLTCWYTDLFWFVFGTDLVVKVYTFIYATIPYV